MRSEQEIARAHALLDSTLRLVTAEVEADYRLIVLASLDALAWVLECPEGETFQNLIEIQKAKAKEERR